MKELEGIDKANNASGKYDIKYDLLVCVMITLYGELIQQIIALRHTAVIRYSSPVRRLSVVDVGYRLICLSNDDDIRKLIRQRPGAQLNIVRLGGDCVICHMMMERL